MSLRRLAIPFSILVLVVLLAVMGRSLLIELRTLSTAGNENRNWTILQADAEVANLYAELADQLLAPEPDSNRVRLRTDIVLSRIKLINEGTSREIFDGNVQGEELLSRLKAYASEAAAIIDSEDRISRESVERLKALTAEIRTDARRLALMGVALGAERSEAGREEFAAELRLTGTVALAVIGALTGLLFVLNRLLRVARGRDRALRASSAKLASTIAASLDAIITANAQGEIIEFNSAAEEIFGWARDDILGRRLDDTIVPPRHRHGMLSFGPGQDPGIVDAGRFEMAALRRNGNEFPAEFNITSVRDGGETHFVAYLRDISNQKINEQKLIDARDRAERADRAKSQFLAIMSHEMRTPLNGILGVLDLLGTTWLSPQQKQYVDIATRSGEVLLDHVNEALDITRAETEALALAPGRFNLAETIARALEVLESLAIEKGLHLQLEIEPGMEIDFIGDGGRIGQIVTNLVGNGIKFTSAGSIDVRLSGIHEGDATSIRIDVRDTGSGIPEEELEHIFEDFVALADSDGRQSRGDGLGLSISRKIARQMGGDLTCTSEPCKGSTFSLSLNLRRAPERTGPDRERRRLPADVGRRVLLVEDNAVNRSVLRDMLANLGHQVREAANGREGVELAERAAFDLILMDISMPEMDGVAAARAIRQGSGPNRATHIEGLTAYGEEEYRALAEEAGMTGFSTKPIRLDTLRAVVEGISVPRRAAEPGHGALQDDVVLELVGAIGPDKTRETAGEFFREVEGVLTGLQVLSAERDADEIAGRLHKLTGAAVVLGFAELAAGLSRARTAIRERDVTGYEAALALLPELAAGSQWRIFEFIASLPAIESAH